MGVCLLSRTPTSTRSRRRASVGATTRSEPLVLSWRWTSSLGSTLSSAPRWWSTWGRPSTPPSTSPRSRAPSFKATATSPWRRPSSALRGSFDPGARRVQHPHHRGLPLQVQRDPAQERGPPVPALLLQGDRGAASLQRGQRLLRDQGGGKGGSSGCRNYRNFQPSSTDNSGKCPQSL